MSLTPQQLVTLGHNPALLFNYCGLTPDAWQRDLLESTAGRILLNCCRQAGKSTAVAAVALHTVLYQDRSLVLLLSPSQRQSGELFRKVVDFYERLGQPVAAVARNAHSLELANGSRVVSLPDNEGNIRSFSGVRLLILDEAARVAESSYKAVRPMLAVSGGRLICLSTPNGKQGFFYRAWIDGETSWQRFAIDYRRCPRISALHIDEERRHLDPTWFNQEYCCSFETPQGLVYPEFPQCLIRAEGLRPASPVRQVGGIDFGFGDPFVALWGVLDANQVLWITGEVYESRRTTQELMPRLPRGVFWFADPQDPQSICILKRDNFKVARAKNAIEPGVQAVTYRIRGDTLRVLSSACPNLIREAGLYRYPSDDEQPIGPKKPIDKDNHTLDALRYLIMGISQ